MYSKFLIIYFFLKLKFIGVIPPLALNGIAISLEFGVFETSKKLYAVKKFNIIISYILFM